MGLFLSKIIHSFVDWIDNTDDFGALVLYFTGCSLNCKDCQNPELKSKTITQDYESIQKMILNRLENNPIHHFILSGGDPLYYSNIDSTLQLVAWLSTMGKVMIYTGLSSDEVLKLNIIGCDYIKCGPYINELKQNSGHFGNEFRLASTNQQIIRGRDIISNNGIFIKG